MKKLLAAAAIVATAGCSTTPVATNDATPVPLARVSNQMVLDPGPSKGTLIIKRDSGFGGSACNLRVFLNGGAVAELSTSEKITMYVTEGEHMVAAEATGICGGKLTEARAVVNKTRPAVFRLTYGHSGELTIQPTAF